MDFQEVIRRRRMHRAFTSAQIPKEKLHRILDIAIRAPSAGFTQGWAFIVVQDSEKKRRLADAAGESFYVRGGHKRFISEAPIVIVPCGSEQRYIDRYREPDKLGPGAKVEFDEPWWLIDAAFASMLIMLTAVNEGLGSCFVGQFYRSEVRDALSIPTDYEPLALIPIGSPEVDKRSRSLIRGRRPLSEVVHYDGW